MKALLLALVLFAIPAIPAAQETLNLAIMPKAATGISHGYALWATDQIPTPFGCLVGRYSPAGVEIHGGFPVSDPGECANQPPSENVIGVVVFLHKQISQEQACQVAAEIRAHDDSLVLFGGVHGLSVGQLQDGRDFPSVRATWCSTPITKSSARPSMKPKEPARQT